MFIATRRRHPRPRRPAPRSPPAARPPAGPRRPIYTYMNIYMNIYIYIYIYMAAKKHIYIYIYGGEVADIVEKVVGSVPPPPGYLHSRPAPPYLYIYEYIYEYIYIYIYIYGGEKTYIYIYIWRRSSRYCGKSRRFRPPASRLSPQPARAALFIHI